MKAEQQPRAVLCEGEVRVEFSEELGVTQIVVALDARVFEGSAGEIG